MSTLVKFLGALAAAASLATAPAFAQSNYPEREIRWIIPWGPGGSNDIMARYLQPLLAEQGLDVVELCREMGDGV